MSWLLVPLGAPRSADVVMVGATEVEVRLGWMFRARIERDAIVAVARTEPMRWGWGAHGWNGRWLVNGSSHDIVELTIDPRQPARLLGRWPLRLRTLWVSLEDPDGFMAALGS
jgi:hypothetical protein